MNLADLRRAVAAVNAVNKLLRSEDVQVIALELSDACDDLNDGLRSIQKLLTDNVVPPGWVRMQDGRILAWNGRELTLYARGKINPILSSSITLRAEACRLIEALYRECVRER